MQGKETDTPARNNSHVFACNLELYDGAREVAHWATLSGLQPGEQEILESLRDRLSEMDMLDVGVGGGRTTPHFAPLVRRYLGTDFAPRMVEACRQRFPAWAFAVADAGDLSAYADRSFDFLLFSYNGLDYLGPSDRLLALSEFRRVLRPGGYLAFSSHNINFLPELRRMRRPQFTWHPRRAAGQLRRWFYFCLYNRHARRSSTLRQATVFEGQLGWRAPTFYVRPDHQLQILQELDWQEIRLFPNEGGEARAADAARIIEPWVYYLCRSPLE